MNIVRAWLKSLLNMLFSKGAIPKDAKHISGSNVLIIMLTHLGDCVIHFPFLAALDSSARYTRPIHLLVKHPLNGMFSEHAGFYVFGFRCPWMGAGTWLAGLASWAKLISHLRREKYDLVIVTHPHFLSSLTARLTGARYMLGYAEKGDKLLHESLPVSDNSLVRERWKLLLEKLGVPTGVGAGDWHPFDSGKIANGRNVVAQSLVGVSMSGEANPMFICVHPGAGGPAKVWPWRNFVALIEKVVAVIDLPVVLVGSAGEAEFCSKIAGELNDRCRVIDLSEKFGVAELFGVFGKAAIYIGNDSGPSHLAAATGIPVFTIFGPASDSAVWRPGGASSYACQIDGNTFYGESSVSEVFKHFQIFLNRTAFLG